MHPDDYQELLHWQYLHGLDIEVVYWNAHILAIVDPMVAVDLVIGWYETKGKLS